MYFTYFLTCFNRRMLWSRQLVVWIFKKRISVWIPVLKSHVLLPDSTSRKNRAAARFHFYFISTVFRMTAVPMKGYFNVSAIIIFGNKSIVFLSYLSNSYVSPNNGLNGFPTRSQFDVAMDIAKAVTYWNDLMTCLEWVSHNERFNIKLHNRKCLMITNHQQWSISTSIFPLHIYHSKEILFKKGGKW